MGKKPSNSVATRPSSENKADRWGFFSGTKALLSSFPHATTGQKASVAAMAFGAAMFIGLGLVGSVTLPAWAVVSMFALATVMIFTTAGSLLAIEKSLTVPFRCRHVPVYPPDDNCRDAVRLALEEVRKDAVDQICAVITDVADYDIRANIFLLAPIVGGQADGKWKLVIHPDFAINMDHPPELQLQLSIGQGATGVAYRDGTYQLTRRLAGPPKKGQWDRKFQMTPELESQIHKRLKWIVSFPLLKPNTREAVGVLNIDGLADVPDDDLLHAVASSIRNNVEVIASHLALHGSLCIGIDQLGVMEHV
jgi:hypothetical protein